MISENVRRRRAAANMTQQKLATAAGLSIGIVASIEAGRTTDPRVSTVTALAGALGCGIEELLTEATGPAKRAKPGGRKTP